MFGKRFFFVCAGLLCLALVYHLGASNAVAKPPGSLADVGVLAGVLSDGETIPLPTFSDGTPAFESDCRWTVSTSRSDHQNLPESEVCYTEGRVVHASSCFNGNCRPEKANYMIIAVRHG
jgi:hypothetical protein